MDVGADMLGIIKTNIKRFCKDTIENLKKDLPSGSYLVLNIKSVIPRDRTVISIGYKYTKWKVLYFIATGNAGITKDSIHYLSN